MSLPIHPPWTMCWRGYCLTVDWQLSADHFFVHAQGECKAAAIMSGSQPIITTVRGYVMIHTTLSVEGDPYSFRYLVSNLAQSDVRW